MRIHTPPADHFLYSLAVSIGKDPASLENWWCLHIKRTDESQSEARTHILKKIKAHHPDIDCDVVLCPDLDILILSHMAQDEQLNGIADEITEATFVTEGLFAECTLYDLARDWRSVRALLLGKHPTAAQRNDVTDGADFGDVASLSDVFHEAKKLRRGRMPQHVMVVEDDAMTRRLVASAFKEHYAIISAANAQEAVMNYLLHAPDIVFLDIGLPDRSGFEVLHQIMRHDTDAFVVMFSANSYLDNITHALSQGASGFVAKPFKKDKLSHYIRESAQHHGKLYQA